MSIFLDAPDLIPSTEITAGSIVYGKIAQTALATDLEHFSDVRIFLLSKISDMCSHLSLGARHTPDTTLPNLAGEAQNCYENCYAWPFCYDFVRCTL